MTRDEWTQLVAVLTAAYPQHEVRPDNVELLYAMLHHLERSDVEAAARRHILTSPFWPSLSELVGKRGRWLIFAGLDEDRVTCERCGAQRRLSAAPTCLACEEEDVVFECIVCKKPGYWWYDETGYCTAHAPRPALSAEQVRALGTITPEWVDAVEERVEPIGAHVLADEPSDVPF